MEFYLPSSEDILIDEGEVKKEVLEKLIKEAYSKEYLFAECKIFITRRGYGYNNKEKKNSCVNYKELWDCYRNLTGKKDYHPYDKEHPFSLAEAFVNANKIEKEQNSLKNLTVEDFIRLERLKKIRKV